MVDIAPLLTPLSVDSPSGPDLEHDAAFLDLSNDLRAKGDDIDAVAGDAVDWQLIARKASALFERSRDLRIAVVLTDAWTATEGLAGLARGLDLITRLCTDLWDSIHPMLDVDDNNDPTMRINALLSLGHGDGLLRMIRSAPWMSVPGFGQVSVRTVEIVLGLLPMPADNPPDLVPAQLEGLLAEQIGKGLPDHAAEAQAQVVALNAVLRAKVGNQAPDLQPLTARLKPLSTLYANARAIAASQSAPASASGQSTGESVAPADGDVQVTAPTAFAANSATSRRRPGEIASREQAIEQLEQVCRYLEQHEPTSPAPLLIRRAQKLMTMNFVEIMRNLAPESLDSLSKITGPTDDDN